MFYECHRETTWEALWEDVDELERPTHYHRKTMATAFFNGTGEYFLNISPRNWSPDTKNFAEGIVGGLEDICHPKGRNPHERRITLHMENAPIHNTRTVMRQLEQSGFKRTEDPADSPDLACQVERLFASYDEQ
jgi:hypothetical protein